MKEINYPEAYPASEAGLKTFVLSKRETSELLQRLEAEWPASAAPDVKSITAHEIEEGTRLLVANNEVVAAQVGQWILPFVGARAEMLAKFPSVTVDMGAVKFVCNGAKVMRPGITGFDSFQKGQIVLVKDQVHGKVLASGIALEGSDEARALSKGYVVENLHYISDKLWEAFKEL